jgi:UrcA family protein
MKTTKIGFNRARLAMIAAGMAFLGCTGQGSPARAAEPIRVNVSYADLNMESPAGVRVLYVRLRSAARRVCAPLDDGRQTSGNFPYLRCYKTALDSAVVKINRPALTAMHENRQQTAGG